MPSLHVLVVEDELAALQVLAAAVRHGGYSVDTAADLGEAKAKLAGGDVDVALCDIQLPDGDGIELLKHSRTAGLETAFVMMTAFASVETAVEALRAGAFDYIIKPARHVEILHRLSQIEAMRGLREENRTLRKAARDSKPLYAFASSQMANVQHLIAKVAPTDSTVLISGESGTGKSVVARAIHDQSGRREAPFLSVNCGAIPDQLLESEFFGHTKGAFTSADRASKGLFLEADQGTLFLDEISELPLLTQTKLLHVIEDKEVRPLGGAQPRRVSTRIIAACNSDLSQLVREGKFREDLYFRLSVFQIDIAPLRERPEDVRGLIRHALRASRQASNPSRALELDPEAEEILLAYRWPGNVREVENVITRACILAEGDSITVDELPAQLVSAAGGRRSSTAVSPDESLHGQRLRFETQVIRRAIEAAGGDRKLAAQRLGISLSSLYGKLNSAGAVPAEAVEERDAAGADRRQSKP
jgi:two-component system response regulator AtoC